MTLQYSHKLNMNMKVQWLLSRTRSCIVHCNWFSSHSRANDTLPGDFTSCRNTNAHVLSVSPKEVSLDICDSLVRWYYNITQISETLTWYSNVVYFDYQGTLHGGWYTLCIIRIALPHRWIGNEVQSDVTSIFTIHYTTIGGIKKILIITTVFS